MDYQDRKLKGQSKSSTPDSPSLTTSINEITYTNPFGWTATFPIISTSAPQYSFRMVAEPSDNDTYTTLHVTDNPEGLIAALDSHKDLVEMNPEGDLGGGLYGSDVPEVWMNRSKRKWEYLDTLTPEQRQAIYQYIYSKNPHKDLTENQQKYLDNTMSNWLEGNDPRAIAYLHSAPYAIEVPDEFLAKLGITRFKPHLVKIRFKGRFIDLCNGRPGWIPVDEWRQKADGAFVRGAAGTPQLVIWNRDSIIDYEETKPSWLIV